MAAADHAADALAEQSRPVQTLVPAVFIMPVILIRC